MIVDELIAILGYDLKGEGNLARFNAGMERAASIARTMSLAIVAAGAAASAAMFALGKGVINVSAEFEAYQTSLETIEGSTEKAKASMDWITKFAATTPYELAGVTEAFIKLRAYGFDPMDGSLKTLGDTASAMNKPLNQAVEAFADAATFEFERLKEFGIKAKQKGEEVTFTWQQNGKELTKVVKKNGKEVTKFLLETFGNRFNGAMVRQSKTWKGMMSNLSDSWQLFQKRIGDKGFFERVKGRLGDLLDYIGRLDQDGTLDRWATRLSNALSQGFDVLSAVIKQVALDLMTIGGLVDAAGGKIGDFLRYISDGKINLDNWQALVAFFGTLLAVLNPAWVAFVGLALAVDDFLTYLRGGKSVIGDLIAALNELVPSVAKAMTDMSTALAAMDWSAVGKAAGAGIVSGIAEAFKGISSLLGSINWGDLGKSIGSSIDFGAIGAAWVGALKIQVDFIRGLFEGLVSGLTKLDWSAIGTAWIGALKGQLDFITGLFTGLNSKIAEAVKGWFSGIDFSALGEKIKSALMSALVAIPAAIIAILTGGDYSAIGKAIGDGILAGLQSMGGQIKAWFASLLPQWASDFFTWKTAKDGDLESNAGDAKKPGNFAKSPDWVGPGNKGAPMSEKDRQRETFTAPVDWQLDQQRQETDRVRLDYGPQQRQETDRVRLDYGPQQPANNNNGGLSRLEGMVSNLSAHMGKMTGDKAVPPIVDNRQDNRDQSISVNPSVAVTVQQIAAAAAATATKTAEAVTGALKNVPSTSRTMRSAHF